MFSLAGIYQPVSADSGNNKIKIVNLQQEINLDYRQRMAEFIGNMEVSWNAKVNTGDFDVKFTIDDLVFQDEDGKYSGTRFGFTSLKKNDLPKITANAVLIEVDGVEKGSLEHKQIVLSEDINENRQPVIVKFKINTGKIDWSQLPAGTYKGKINIHSEEIDLITPSNSVQDSPELVVNIKQAPEIVLDGNEISWEIAEPARKDDQYSEAVAWEIINDTENLMIQFSSIGGEKEGNRNLADPDQDYKNFFEYIIYQGENHETSDKTFSPGEYKQVSSYTQGKIRLCYKGDIAKNRWIELEAGKYHDIVEITISAVD